MPGRDDDQDISKPGGVKYKQPLLVIPPHVDDNRIPNASVPDNSPGLDLTQCENDLPARVTYPLPKEHDTCHANSFPRGIFLPKHERKHLGGFTVVNTLKVERRVVYLRADIRHIETRIYVGYPAVGTHSWSYHLKYHGLQSGSRHRRCLVTLSAHRIMTCRWGY